MPSFPFLQSFSSSYRFALQGQAEPVYSSADQQLVQPYGSQASAATVASVGAAGLLAAGFIKSGSGTVWDRVHKLARTVEEASPGGVLRTFGVSDFGQQFTTGNLKSFSISPAQIKDILKDPVTLNWWTANVGNIVGANPLDPEILSKGIEFVGGETTGTLKIAGEGGRVLSPHVTIVKGRELGEDVLPSRAGKAAMMHAGYKVDPTVASTAIEEAKYLNRIAKAKIPTSIGDMPMTFISGQTKAKHAAMQAGAYATESVERFNRLLQAGIELAPESSQLNEAIGKRNIRVRPRGALDMVGRLGLKIGVGSGLALMSYQMADFLVRDLSVFNQTPLDNGITALGANLIASTSVMYSRLGSLVGAQEYVAGQEQIAPGSTDLTRLLGFPLAGGVLGATISYGQGLAARLNISKAEGISFVEASDIWRTIELQDTKKALEQVADIKGFRGRAAKLLAGHSKLSKAVFFGAGLGAIPILPFLPGALLPGKSSEELEDIYTGEQLVPIKKGRYWLFGRSAFEGGRVIAHRPHLLAELAAGRSAADVDLYGPDEPSPLAKFWMKNFTYDLERAHYYRRPAPLTASAFEDVPLIGPLLAGTIGKLVKPQLYMHQEQWMQQDPITGETHYKHLPPGFGATRHLGVEHAPGAPVNPLNAEQVIGEQMYRMTEMIGLPGFFWSSIKGAVTGAEEFFDQETRMATFGRATSAERSYWDLMLGDPGYTELLRRLLPHRRRQIEEYNPISNTAAPTWLPGPGERGINFQTGDPYCVSGKTLIETPNSLVLAQDIEVGDLIKSHKGVWLPVHAIAKRKVNQDEKVFEIKTTSLAAYPIQVSEEHPLLTPNGWTEAQDIEAGNYVGYPIPKLKDLVQDEDLLDLAQYTSLPYTKDHIYMTGTQEQADCRWYIENVKSSFNWGERKKVLEEHGWTDWIFEHAQQAAAKNTQTRIPRYINPDSKEWGIISGYYLSEGFIQNCAVGFAFHENETKYHEELIGAFEALFGITGRVYGPYNNTHGVSVVCCNKALSEILSNIWGKGFDKKHLFPQWSGSVKETLRCLFNGDGSFYFDKGKPRLSLKLVNAQLLWEVRQVLLALGFVGYIVEDNLLLRGQAAKDCALFLGCKYQECSDSSYISRHTYIKDGYVWMRVFSKTEVSEEIVYGFEVNQDDSFCAAGVATHNTKITSGEARLPGPGYESRFPELQGLDAEDYPLIHQYKILSDVSPYSQSFKDISKSVSAMRNAGDFTEYDEKIFQQVERQLAERKGGKQFFERKYSDVSAEALASHNANIAATGGLMSSLHGATNLGGLWEGISHGVENIPLVALMENLTPVSPLAKFTHIRSSIEDYERTQLYGSEMAFWNKPVEDFMAPAVKSVARSFGMKFISPGIRHRRSTEEYFDALQYIKSRSLEDQALAADDYAAAQSFENQQRETLTGVNPYTRDYTSLYRALPSAERDYFKAFEMADTPQERARILSLVPGGEKALYLARWRLRDADEARSALDNISQATYEEAKETQAFQSFYREQRADGFPINDQLLEDYKQTRVDGESYGDWYRRNFYLPSKLAGRGIPGPDWTGWYPHINLQDVKLHTVENLGHDVHDYNLWESDRRAAAYRPGGKIAAQQLASGSLATSPADIRQTISNIASYQSAFSSADITSVPGVGLDGSIEIDVEHDITNDIRNLIVSDR